MGNKPRIHDLESLRIEKRRLEKLAEQHHEVVSEDIEYLKEAYSPANLLNSAAKSIVPEAVRHSAVVNDPINYVAKTVFNRGDDVVEEHSDRGRGNQLRNIVLGLAETVGAYLLTKYIRRKI